MSDVPAPDQPARDRIRDDLAATLFVEAGAGSGKTSALVTRVHALVDSGVPLAAIAAITFTEKAAAELRDRIRQTLEKAAAAASDEAQRSRLTTALGEVDASAIGTLHAFAQRLLREHPVEVGLPPRVEVLDEVESEVEFEQRWATCRDRLLADPQLARTLLLLFATGTRPDALRALAVAFNRNWDLVDERVPDVCDDPPDVVDALEPVLKAVDAVLPARVHCIDAGDALCGRLDELERWARRMRAATDESELLELACGDDVPSFRVTRTGNQRNWPRFDHDAVRNDIIAIGDQLAEVVDDVLEACARRIATELCSFTLGAAGERREAGRLEFHDLLVLARALLRDPQHGAAVRARLQARYQRLLLDEFQDTDPIQLELAMLLAAADPAAAAGPWFATQTQPGHLFFVGDPKQSIYRFRRADIGTFLAAREHFGAAARVELVANFRTVAPVIDWLNHVFGELLQPTPPDEAPSQAAYEPLVAVRSRPPLGAPVAVVGRTAHDDGPTADELRAREAADVVDAIRTAMHERWSVGTGSDGWRAPTLGDIAILVPARTSLPFLEEALDDAGIAYRAESSSLVYGTRAVRDLLLALRAIDDPTDHLAIVATLRSPLFGCADDALFVFKQQRRGRWNYRSTQPDTVPADDPVALALGVLRQLHDDRQWLAPSELLDRLARDRRALELGYAEGRPRDVWRRVRFVIDQARQWTEATGGNLRQYLRWVAQQTVEGARVAESVLPETDDDAVRIMTIHAAKGLEFPIVVLSGLSTVPQARPGPADVVFPPSGEPGYRFGSRVKTEQYREFVPIDEQMAFDERVRLLYVACTRARDHLVVSLHRKTRSKPPEPDRRTNAELLVDGMGPLLDDVPDAAADSAVQPELGFDTSVVPHPVPPFDEWQRELERALAGSSRPRVLAATALTADGTPDAADDPGLAKRPRDLDLPPWHKGRYGTAVGRAVHAVLQTVDLTSGAGLDDAVAAQAAAEGVLGREDEIAALARAALASPTVQAAAARPHWREVHVAVSLVPDDPTRLLEGYVDLLYRDDDGSLVVADYKTGAADDDEVLDDRMARYRFQGAAYADAVAAATGDHVSRCVFVFLTTDGPIERELVDLADAVREVRAVALA